MTISIPQGQWYKWNDGAFKCRGRWEGSPRHRRFYVEVRDGARWVSLESHADGAWHPIK